LESWVKEEDCCELSEVDEVIDMWIFANKVGQLIMRRTFAVEKFY